MFSLKGITSNFSGKRRRDDRWQFFRSILTAIESSPNLAQGLTEAAESAAEELGCQRMVLIIKEDRGWVIA
ncbi:MAG: hypothetical protein ACREAC_25185, partial [Blastocatellia bacterium]